MVPSKEYIDMLDRESIADSLRMTFEQKFLAGAELFDYACAITKAGIRNEHPHFDEAQVVEQLRRRIALSERIEAAR